MQELIPGSDLGFQKPVATKNEETNLIASTEAKAIAEVQAAYVIAKKFPRNGHGIAAHFWTPVAALPG